MSPEKKDGLPGAQPSGARALIDLMLRQPEDAILNRFEEPLTQRQKDMAMMVFHETQGTVPEFVKEIICGRIIPIMPAGMREKIEEIRRSEGRTPVSLEDLKIPVGELSRIEGRIRYIRELATEDRMQENRPRIYGCLHTDPDDPANWTWNRPERYYEHLAEQIARIEDVVAKGIDFPWFEKTHY
jgi:hypothetical protein